MEKFRRADKIIISANDVNYWQEFQVDEVRDLAAEFEESDWRALETSLSGKPSQWKARFAQSLDGNQSDHAVEVLLSFLGGDDFKTVVHAIHSLDSIEDKSRLRTLDAESLVARAKSTIESASYRADSKQTYISLLQSLFAKQ